jgi:Sel1 repeat
MPASHGSPWTWIVCALIFSTVGWSSVALADSYEARQWIDAGDCKRAGDAINDGLAKNEASAYALAGYLYSSTGCVKSDHARAARFFQRAVELGDRDSRNILGFMYGVGDGVPQDFRVAFHWFFFGEKDHDGLTPEEEMERGYVYTVSYYARTRVDKYPGARPANVDVLFKVATGEVSFRAHESTTDHGTNQLFRSTPYTEVIADGYAEGIKVIPKPPELLSKTQEFVVPWVFKLQ